MKTEVAILKYKDKPIGALQVKEMSANEYLKLKAECEKNTKDIDDSVSALLNRVDQLENHNQQLQNKVKYLLGEITKEEYERLCGNK